jgi:transcription elongation factor Elf1
VSTHNSQENALVSLPNKRTEKENNHNGNQFRFRLNLRYKGTCPVCGQTPKYWGDLDLGCAVKKLSKKYECTCPVCGQTHKYKKGV